MKSRILLVAVVLLTASSMAGAGQGGKNNMFWGGWVGAGFGTVDYVEISPTFGIYPMEKLATGIRLTYRYRNDSRFSPELSTSDYGGGLFARYFLIPQLFVQGEYDYLSYEYIDLDYDTVRTSANALLGGGGYSMPMGPHAAFNATILYDLLHDSGDPYRPYDSPWVFRVGVGVGF